MPHDTQLLVPDAAGSHAPSSRAAGSNAAGPSRTTARARVLCLVDRDERGLAYERALRRADDLACAGTLRAVDELAEALASDAPAVVVVDVAEPGVAVFRRIAELRARRPDVAFVVVHPSEESTLVRVARECGARGFVVGCLGIEATLASVRAVLADAPRAWASPRGAC